MYGTNEPSFPQSIQSAPQVQGTQYVQNQQPISQMQQSMPNFPQNFQNAPQIQGTQFVPQVQDRQYVQNQQLIGQMQQNVPYTGQTQQYGMQIQMDQSVQQQQQLSLQQQIALKALEKHGLETLLIQEQIKKNPFRVQFHHDRDTSTSDFFPKIAQEKNTVPAPAPAAGQGIEKCFI